MQWLTTLSVPLALTAIWFYALTYTRSSSAPRLSNRRIWLLIAHPDDEAMFFAPTLQALTANELNNIVNVLCLSSGNADNLGSIRKQELRSSCKLLCVPTPPTIIDDPELQDSMSTIWPTSRISEVLQSTVGEQGVDTIVTFDEGGVSGHTNHVACLRGAREYIHHHQKEEGIELYTLTSIPIYRKYLWVFDAAWSMASFTWRKNLRRQRVGERLESLLFVSTPAQVRVAQRAMTEAHVSQMRWFRWGWIGFSRYMAVNDLVLEKVD